MRALILTPLLLLAACESSSVEDANAAAEANAIAASAATSSDRVALKAADGTVIGANFAEAAEPHALILLFHQAGSSKEEYGAIQPRLAAAGFSSLAIDQRVGGDLFGGNQTARIAKNPEDYRVAKPDLEAALAWAKDKGLPVILWGSSYSASLAFVVAAEHPGEVAAVMAFSPGEYFDGNPSIRDAAAKVNVPVFVTSSAEAKEVAEAKAILAAVPSANKVQFVPQQGVHGSSILLADRNAAGAEAAWKAVLDFLAGIGKPPAGQ